jgi:hypothetical protein
MAVNKTDKISWSCFNKLKRSKEEKIGRGEGREVGKEEEQGADEKEEKKVKWRERKRRRKEIQFSNSEDFPFDMKPHEYFYLLIFVNENKCILTAWSIFIVIFPHMNILYFDQVAS